MPTTATMSLTDAADTLQRAADSGLQNQSADEFETLERHLARFEAAVRERQQALWATEVRTALKHLEHRAPLTPADQQVIRVFLVSDAEQYLAQENNFPDWTAELRRLLGDITRRAQEIDGISSPGSAESPTLTAGAASPNNPRDAIAQLRGVLKDAIRLVPDIRNYLDEQRRVALFNEALTHIEEQTRQTLIQLLQDQLSDPTR